MKFSTQTSQEHIMNSLKPVISKLKVLLIYSKEEIQDKLHHVFNNKLTHVFSNKLTHVSNQSSKLLKLRYQRLQSILLKESKKLNHHELESNQCKES